MQPCQCVLRDKNRDGIGAAGVVVAFFGFLTRIANVQESLVYCFFAIAVAGLSWVGEGPKIGKGDCVDFVALRARGICALQQNALDHPLLLSVVVVLSPSPDSPASRSRCHLFVSLNHSIYLSAFSFLQLRGKGGHEEPSEPQ